MSGEFIPFCLLAYVSLVHADTISAAAIRSIDPAACTKGRLPGYKAVITDKVVLKTAAETRGNRPEIPGGYAASGGGGSSTDGQQAGSAGSPPAPQAQEGSAIYEYPQSPVGGGGGGRAAPPPPPGGEPPSPTVDGQAGEPSPAVSAAVCAPAVAGAPCWTDGATGCAGGIPQVCTASAGQPGTFGEFRLLHPRDPCTER
jgi:hypothetical protein